MRNIVTLLSPVYLCCLRVTVIRHEPSHLLATRYGSYGVLDLYALYALWTSTVLSLWAINLNTCQGSSRDLWGHECDWIWFAGD